MLVLLRSRKAFALQFVDLKPAEGDAGVRRRTTHDRNRRRLRKWTFRPEPPFSRAFEALSAIMAQHGRARMAAWARSAEDDPTRIVAVMFENTTLALALLRDLDRAHRSGNPKRVTKVRRRLDRVLAALATRD
jgi:hypothetical protein